MTLTRRDAIRISGGALAGLSAGLLIPEQLRSESRPVTTGEPKPASQDGLAEVLVRDRVELPLNPDGSAPEHSENAAGPIEGVLWRYTGGEPPDIEFDYRRMRVEVDPRPGEWRRSGGR